MSATVMNMEVYNPHSQTHAILKCGTCILRNVSRKLLCVVDNRAAGEGKGVPVLRTP